MSKIIKNSIGQKIGRLLIIKQTNKRSGNGSIIWLCRCDCGKIKEVSANNLGGTNRTRSCGCWGREVAITANLKHGDASGGKTTRLYRIWHGIKDRCLRAKNQNYYRYGGRGISVHEEWVNDYAVFKAWALSNGYKDNLTLDRINSHGNYEPTNCRWVTRSKNSKRVERGHLIGYVKGYMVGYIDAVKHIYSKGLTR